MAITKAIRGAAKNHGGLRNTIEYVLRDDKVKEGYVEMIGPSPDKLTWDSVYNSFLDEKKTWDKDSGRMCSHYVLSFHKDEKINPQQALNLAKTLAEKSFPGFQVLMGVHQDRDHLHVHMVVNTVNYETGVKLHTKKQDLQKMKNITNELCKERGLTVAEKGKHFDGSAIEEGEGIAWNKDKYHLMTNESKKSYLIACATAVMDSKDNSESREEFIHEMGARGWAVNWSDKRKHITFEDPEGHKVRDSNLSKSFTIDISKETLEHEFERKKEKNRVTERELNEYYRQIEDSIRGFDKETGVDNQRSAGNGQEEGCSDSRPDLDKFRTKNDAIEFAEAESKAAAEQRRLKKSRWRGYER